MKALALTSLRIFALRWLRGWGYRGHHTGAIIGALVAALAAASVAAAFWTHSQFLALDRLPPSFRPVVIGALVIVLFISGGLVQLLSESIRLSGSRLGAALSTLPLSSMEIRLLLWLPVLVASLAMQLLLFVPAVAAFSALRFPLARSLIAALAALVLGYGAATLVVFFVHLILGGRRWASVRYPAMLLAWMGFCGVEVWQTITELGGARSEGWRLALLAPWLSREFSQGRVPALLLGAVVLAVVPILALLAWSGGHSTEGNYGRVAWQWSSRWKPALVTLELTRMLRSSYLLANFIGAEVVGLGLVVGLWKLPPVLRPYLFTAALATIMLFSALPLALIRGLTRAKWPVPLLVGYGAAEWTLNQILVGVGLAVCVAAPPLAAASWLLGSTHDVLVVGLPLLAVSCGLAIWMGWLVPSGVDDPLGQAFTTFALFLSIQILELVLDRVFHAGSPTWIGLLLLLGSLGIAGAILLERRRWDQLVPHASHV